MRIAIVDDDRLVCDALAIILGAQADIEVCGIGCDGEAALGLARTEEPDVLLMDIQMPGRDGLSAAEAILREQPAARIVFLTTFSDDEYIVRALRMGARGYLIKQDVAAIPAALRAVMSGASVLEGAVLERVAHMGGDAGAGSGAGEAEQQSVREGHPQPPATAAPGGADDQQRPAAFAALTEREYEVARLIADGLDNREIAAAAYLGEGTVRNHISSILAKLHLRNRTQIAIAFWRAQR